jgi:hypothetical protein
VSDFRQTVRGVTGTVERSPVATTEKARLGVGIEHVLDPSRQLAVLLDEVPNAVLAAAPLFRRFFDSEGRLAIDKALDAHVLGRILAADPPRGLTGDGLVEQTRHAVTAMRAAGHSPSVLVVNPEDAADLDLAVDGGGSYVFDVAAAGSASPLWGVRVREVPGLTAPLLLDPIALGSLYLGRLAVEADPFSGFSRNVTALRFEVNALMHVRDVSAARVLAAEPATP